MDGAPCRQEDGSSDVVGVGVCDSTPLLWRMKDLKTLRRLGLVGALLGSLSRTPRQNGRLGRPVLLLPEEDRLLRELHAATALPTASQDLEGAELQHHVDQYQEIQRQSLEQQKVLALADRKSTLLRAMESSQIGPGSDEALRRRLEELECNFTFPTKALTVQLSTVRAGLSYCPEERLLLPVDRPIGAQHDPRADVRFEVFKDLRGRGLYLTSAGKFGGDFLVYPGDPLCFHAHFIAVCLSLDESLGLLDVLAIARLGSNVKKTVLLCSLTDGGVRYTSLQWSGMV